MIVLSDKKLNKEKIESRGAKVEYVSGVKQLSKYNNNSDVVAVCGSRAMAIKCVDMNLPSLKFIQLTSAGFDGVPIDLLLKKGVTVANAGDTYSVPIAETVVLAVLLFAKRLRKNPNNRRFKIQRGYNLITELSQKKVLIMGAGRIGTAIADRLLGFNVVIDGYDPFCSQKPQYTKIIRNKDELKKCLGDYDYIISTLPHNEQTESFIDAHLFRCMNKNAIIVNVGRRKVFNENDFYCALKQGEIAGAVLDIFEKLPNPITNRFRRLKNVIVLPGVSAISKELNYRLSEYMTENVMACLKCTEIKNIINGVK